MRCPRVLLAFAAALAVAGTVRLGAETIDGSSYACRPLAAALEDLQARGLPIVFSSNLVRDDLRVETVPTAGSPRRLLDQLLAPHGLRVQDGAGGRLLVVQDFLAGSDPPTWPVPTAAGAVEAADPAPIGGVLPAWVDRGTSSLLAVIEVPAAGAVGAPAARLPAGTRYLILRLVEPDPEPWERLAFDLKALIVEARAGRGAAETLKVALEASPAATERLLTHDLAPYLDAYVYRRTPRLPEGDPSARPWWRAPADDRALHTLLRGAAQGAELVVLEGPGLDPAHRLFLQRIQATPSVDLERQPAVEGMAPERVRFLYNLESGSYYLAVYADLGRRQTLAFSLEEGLEARVLYPEGAAFSHLRLARRTELELPGDHPHYLLELRRHPPNARNGVLRVDGEPYIDPYEVVVKNQVFQEREAGKVRSLVVMERRHSVSQSRAARQVTWEHRIIERRGRLTEYHHLGVERNGVPFPERKLRVGRDFRAEAELELDPLEIELDRTYRYELLGEERVDGEATWKIGFEPVLAGAYLSGVVWIDQQTSAHRKLQAIHTGLRGLLISREVTRYYGWVPDDGRCFWNWTQSRGLSIVESGHTQVAYAVDTERHGFDYNRDDLEVVVREAHLSDVAIHVATPPDGHRWLVRPDPRKELRRLLGRRFSRRGAGRPDPGRPDPPAVYAQASLDLSRDSVFGPPGPGSGLPGSGPPAPELAAAASDDEPFDGRVLADHDAYSTVWEAFLIARGNCTNRISCSGVGFDYRRSDLFANGSEVYAGLYDQRGWASLTHPRLFGSDWVMTASLYHDFSFWENGVRNPPVAVPGSTGFEERRSSAWLSLARPLSRRFRLRGSYGLRNLDLRRAPWPADFTLPGSVFEQIGEIELDFGRRGLYAQASFEVRRRGDADPWGIDLSEPLRRSPRRLTLVAGTSRRLAGDRSLGARVVFQQGWDLDHFSHFGSGGRGVRTPGFQPQRFDRGWGASVSYSSNVLRRVPVTLRLEGAALRRERYSDENADQLGLAVETFLNGWLGTDLFLRLGYGLTSSREGEAGELKSSIMLSRRF